MRPGWFKRLIANVSVNVLANLIATFIVFMVGLIAAVIINYLILNNVLSIFWNQFFGGVAAGIFAMGVFMLIVTLARQRLFIRKLKFTLDEATIGVYVLDRDKKRIQERQIRLRSRMPGLDRWESRLRADEGAGEINIEPLVSTHQVTEEIDIPNIFYEIKFGNRHYNRNHFVDTGVKATYTNTGLCQNFVGWAVIEPCKRLTLFVNFDTLSELPNEVLFVEYLSGEHAEFNIGVPLREKLINNWDKDSRKVVWRIKAKQGHYYQIRWN